MTVALTPRQVQLAAQPNALWAQGGMPGDPVLNALYPSTYGFGALRCAIDALNGDNVEFISYPTGARHVFCYAYYVTPPPTSGTIIINKQLDVPAGGAAQTFTYHGDISYTADQSFTLTAGPGQPGSETFYRAGGQTWSFSEDALPGYSLESLQCASATGASTTDTNATTGAAAVHLAPSDTVTFTYVNGLTPPPPVRPTFSGLIVAKRTIGGAGTFPVDVHGTTEEHVDLTTTPDKDVAASPLLTLEPGRYVVEEGEPDAGAAGTWALTGAVYNGLTRARSRSGGQVAVNLPEGEVWQCLLTNTFTPGGSITVHKVTDGGTATVGFLIRPQDDSDPHTYAQSATTTRPGVAATATGDATNHLPLGSYAIIETNPSTPNGSWTLDGVVCDGVPVGAAQGRAIVTLTNDHPAADCTYYDHFTRGAEPENPSTPPGSTSPGQPTPPGEVGAAAADGPTANLSITKTVTPRVARPGQRVVSRIVVVNHGPATAYDVVGTELSASDRRLLTVHASRGTCTHRRPVHCRVGAIKPGGRVVVTAITHALPRASRTVNRVAVVTSTSERQLSDNRAQATTIVRAPARAPAVTG